MRSQAVEAANESISPVPIAPAGPNQASHCVVGSGPAGVACAYALLEQGATVHMLDAGIALEPERADWVAQMRRTASGSWTREQLAQLKAGTSASAKGIPLKLVYGSDFPYRECERHMLADFQGVGIRPSLAQGGLSNVWGAAMLPYQERDLVDWPIGVAHLAEHYKAVLKFTGLSARHDDLEQFFPLYADQTPALKLSRQAEALLQRLQRNRESLARAGIYSGQARLSVQAPAGPQAPGCVYCGVCMYGCPYGYIYNSADTLRQLRSHARFSYQADTIVTKVRETSDRVILEGYDRLSGQPFATEARRAYLAAGVIPTARILLSSLGLYDQPLWMKDSQYFLVPLATLKGAGDVRHESLHTLCQAFLEIFDAGISPFTVHIQIYSYSDLIGQAVAGTMGPLAKPLGFLARALEGRLLVAQCYLHSNHSSQIKVTLERGVQGRERLQLQAQLNPQTRPLVRRVLRKLTRHAHQLGALPVWPMLQIAEPGRGFHGGGTFPMRLKPAGQETDSWGRPCGWQRVHAVDATVLPGIPATTITFTVMANAHRIGSETASLERVM